MALTQNFSSCYESTAYQTAFTPLITPPAHTHLNRHNAPAFTWTTTQRAIILTLSLLLLHRTLSSFKSRNTEPAKQKLKRPSQVPYSIPILGNLPQFLYAPQELARQISTSFPNPTITTLRMLTHSIHIPTGAPYLTALFKDTSKTLTSQDALHRSLSHMFGVPGAEMPFFTSDRTGSAHEPHPDAPARDKDTRVSYLMLKTVADHLSGPGLAATAVRFQGAMGGQIGAIVMGEEWIEMDDLFVFVRGLVARATCETMLGSKFLAQFPDFVDSFYTYNDRIRRFLQGWPRFLIPRAWAARKRCTEIMRLWKRGVEADGESFDGSPMMVKRWAWFEKWGISEDAIAASDLGILWGTFSNAIILTFWLCWHALQDGELLAAATAEVEECRKEDSSLDTAKLMSQPLLQSMHAEALRKYVAVYIPRTTEYGATQILDYEIPKNKLLVINSGMAHMDERNWNLGPQNQYPVTKFWGERFLTPDTAEGSDQADKTLGTRNGKPKFSLSKYKGAWVPFGGGIHQCPARHWVKTQMLVSLAMIIGSFDIELLDGGKELEVGLAKYGLGALNPGEKAPFRIRRKRRSS